MFLGLALCGIGLLTGCSKDGAEVEIGPTGSDGGATTADGGATMATDGGATDGGATTATDGGGACETPWFRDGDGDGYGDPADGVTGCEAPEGYVARDGDCDDGRAEVHPEAAETCETPFDDDCDGQENEQDAAACASLWADLDLDGYGAGDAQCWCAAVDGRVALDGDCDDGDPRINPGAEDVADDGLDNDCNGLVGRWSGEASPSSAAGVWDGPGRSNLGMALAFVGDLDGDGLDDHALGDPRWDYMGFRDGGVAVVLGSGEGEREMAEEADALLVSTTRYEAGFGSSVVGLPDVDGDGFAELAVGAPSERSSAVGGTVYIYKGPLSGLYETADADIALPADGTDVDAGVSLAVLSDATGDGVADLLVGVPGADSTRGDDVGGAWLIAGPMTADADLQELTVTEIVGVARNDEAGRAVASAGDVDGDGLADMLIGAPECNRPGTAAGAAYLVLGGSTGSVRLADADWIVEAGGMAYSLGYALAGVGDLDGDGNMDVAIGAPTESTHESYAGAVFIFHSPRSGTFSTSSADAVVVGSRRSDCAGRSIAAAGDQDGDGKADLFIGAPDCSSGSARQGRLALIHGPVTSGTLDDVGSWHLLGTEGGLGGAVAGGGDSNGDGIPDMIVSASEFDGSGRVYLFQGTSF